MCIFLVDQAIYFFRRKEYEPAGIKFKRVLRDARSIGEGRTEARALGNLATVSSIIGMPGRGVSRSAPSCPVLSCPVVPWRLGFRPILSCSGLAWPCPALPCRYMITVTVANCRFSVSPTDDRWTTRRIALRRRSGSTVRACSSCDNRGTSLQNEKY